MTTTTTNTLRLLAPVDRGPVERWIGAVRRESRLELVPGVAAASPMALRTGMRPSPVASWVRAVRREPMAA